jgi:hypothetical protein
MLQSTNETYSVCGIVVRDQSATLMGMVASFGSLALLMAALRVIDRAISAHVQLGWDDLLISLSGVCNNIFTLARLVKYADDQQLLGRVYWNECASHRSCYFGFWKGHVEHST